MDLIPQPVNGNQEILAQIYKLRVEAYDQSENRSYINKVLYPDGYTDNLDSSAFHWYVEDRGKVVGCVRMNLLTDLSQFEEGELFKGFDIPAGPFAFFSKVAVHPDYRDKNLAYLLGAKSVEAFNNSPVRIGLTLIPHRNYAEKYGFKYLGDKMLGSATANIKVGVYLLVK